MGWRIRGRLAEAALELHLLGLLAHAAERRGFLEDFLGRAVVAWGLAAAAEPASEARTTSRAGVASASAGAAGTTLAVFRSSAFLNLDLGERLQGLDGEADAAVAGIDLEDLAADDLVHLEGVFDLADALMVDLRDVDEAINAGGDFDERAELEELGDLAGDFGAFGDRVDGGREGIALDLLEAEADAVGFELDLEDLDGDALAFLDVLLDGLFF